MSFIHECLEAMSCVKEAITMVKQDVYKGLYSCIHFVDDWVVDLDEEWHKLFLGTKVVVDIHQVVTYWFKVGIVEDWFNKRW